MSSLPPIRLTLSVDGDTKLPQISNCRGDKFYFAFVSNDFVDESEIKCIEDKV